MATALQSARNARGWSQARAVWELTRLAESRGMKVASASSLKTQLSRWENGHVMPDYYRDLLCDFYDISSDDLEIRPEPQSLAFAPDDSYRPDPMTTPEWQRTLEQVDQETGWEPGAARHKVAEQLARLDPCALHDRASRRRRVGQHDIAEALGDYYLSKINGDAAGFGRYGARLGREREILTSVLTRPDWLDLDCPLNEEGDQISLARTPVGGYQPLSTEVAAIATQRLAEALVAGSRLVDLPLYRLTHASVRKGQITGSVALMPFVRYALTMDLLEGELTDALAAGKPALPGSLPLRDRYLPDLPSVLDLAGRICAGGTLALCAIARPAQPHRPADYALLVQSRSDQVLNAPRRLSVIPKGFHQPMTDFLADAPIGATLRRQIEKELFGREDTDRTRPGGTSVADPMHPSRLSEPMRWLTEQPGRLRLECTGFGLNLVSGNFEFASLIVIDSDEFWTSHGGHVEANWESSSLRLYSSLDGDSLTELASDADWSNEGLFAFLQGLRRLRQISAERVSVPPINWEIR